jgi:hypothetical protein
MENGRGALPIERSISVQTGAQGSWLEASLVILSLFLRVSIVESLEGYFAIVRAGMRPSFVISPFACRNRKCSPIHRR